MALRFLMLSCNFVFVHQRFRRTFAMLLEEAVSARLRFHAFSKCSTDVSDNLSFKCDDFNTALSLLVVLHASCKPISIITAIFFVDYLIFFRYPATGRWCWGAILQLSQCTPVKVSRTALLLCLWISFISEFISPLIPNDNYNNFMYFSFIAFCISYSYQLVIFPESLCVLLLHNKCGRSYTFLVLQSWLLVAVNAKQESKLFDFYHVYFIQVSYQVSFLSVC